MMIRYLTILFLLWFSTPSLCKQVEKTIVIATKYINGEHLFFSYNNHFRDNITSFQIQPNGPWRVIQTDNPLLITFSRNMKLYPALLLPGDTIQAKYTPEGHVEFFGNRASNDLNALNRIEQKIGVLIPSLSGIKITKKLNFNYLSKAFDSLHLARVNLLDSIYYQDKNEIYRQLLVLLKHRLCVDYLRIFLERDTPLSFEDIPKSYISKCLAFKDEVNINDNFHSPFYKWFVLTYNRFISIDSGFYVDDQESLYKIAKQSFSDKGRDFLLFFWIKEGLIHNDAFVQDFKVNCKNDQYVNYIDSLVSRTKKFLVSEDVLASSLTMPNNTKISFRQFLEKNNGKPIYLDFWASWCQPCIKEFKFLKESEERHSEITFLSISIDQDSQKWRSAISKYSLDVKKQYLIDKDSYLAKFFAIKDIPRFILLDSRGRIISSNAPRPSNTRELTILLENTLDH